MTFKDNGAFQEFLLADSVASGESCGRWMAADLAPPEWPGAFSQYVMCNPAPHAGGYSSAVRPVGPLAGEVLAASGAQ